MKTAIIVAYFGKLPNYFQLFLDSCAQNPGFDWILFTDDDTRYDYPPNVHCVEISFEECRKRIQSRFDFTIALSAPQKLCDYKCAYGYIFEDELKDYDWWGHCDLDQIFGDLSSFVTEDKLRSFDKIYSLGHLTLYRNNENNNRMFMADLYGKARYREVFTTEKGQGFDEWLPGSINEIYQENNIPALFSCDGADINPYHMTFTLSHYDMDKKCYENARTKNSVFLWDDGKLYQIYIQNGKMNRREYPYVHLQKREMKDCRSACSNAFYIVPNMFVDAKQSEKTLLCMSALRGLLNTQYFRVKWKSFKYRIKNNDWELKNVFHS